MVSVVNNPEPAGIDEPVNENPSTVAPPADTAKPAAPALPPEPPVAFTPVTSNWNPPTASEFVIYTSAEPDTKSTLPNSSITTESLPPPVSPPPVSPPPVSPPPG